MSSTAIAVLGGLVGSILTTFIARAFDLIQKKNEHHYSLRKSFFERKLHAAEAAISQRYIFSSCLKSLSALYAEVSKHLLLVLSMPPVFLMGSLENITKQVNKITEPAFDSANSISLFFDLDKFENPALVKEALDLTMSLGWRNMILPILIEKYSKAGNTSERDEALHDISNHLGAMQSDIANLSSKLDAGVEEVSAVIKEIRAHMKKYDS